MERYSNYRNALRERPEIANYLLEKIDESPKKYIIVKIVDIGKQLGDPHFEQISELAISLGLKFVFFVDYDIYAETKELNEINPKTGKNYLAFKLRRSVPNDRLPKSLEQYLEEEIIDCIGSIEILGKTNNDYILRDTKTKEVLNFDLSTIQNFRDEDLEYISIANIPRYTIGKTLQGNVELFLNMRTREFAAIFDFENRSLIHLDIIKIGTHIDENYKVEKTININNEIRNEIRKRGDYIISIRRNLGPFNIIYDSIGIGHLRKRMHLGNVDINEFCKRLKIVMWQNFNIHVHYNKFNISDEDYMQFSPVKHDEIFYFS